MNWLTNFVRPKLRALVSRKEAPENLWLKCPKCEQMLFMRDWEANQEVCNHCGHHMRIRPLKRLPHLFDEGKYELHPLPRVTADPLKFRDTKRYDARLKEAQAKAEGTTDALVVASGPMGGRMAIVALLDFGFMGGSMGTAVGEGLVMAADLAVARKAPLIVFSASGGARMQEGILSLMQLTRTTIAVRKVKEAGLPYIVVLTDPTTGGVSASVRHAGRRPYRRARRHHWLRRSAGDPGHDPPGAAALGFPALGIPARARHGRRRRAPPQAARDADPPGFPFMDPVTSEGRGLAVAVR